jgi:nucleotide-binding universal stress UspA family protein
VAQHADVVGCAKAEEPIMTATDTMLDARIPGVLNRDEAALDPAWHVGGPVVAAVGGSESWRVLRAARHVSTLCGSEVLAITVVEPPPSSSNTDAPSRLVAEFEERRREDGEDLLAREVFDAAGSEAVWKTAVIAGDPVSVLTDLTTAARSHLLVMGLGRYAPWDRMLGRETTLRVVRRSSCPVLAVSRTCEPPFRSVLIATDFSPSSAAAARKVMPALSDGADLYIVHCWQPVTREDGQFSALDERYRLTLPDRFARFRALLDVPDGVTVRQEIREGRTPEQLLEVVSRREIDLIVVGREGPNAKARLVPGSVTTSMLRAATCALLIAGELTPDENERLQALLST